MFPSRRYCPTIGVLTGWQVYSGILDSFLEHVVRGIQAAAKARGCNLLLACGASNIQSFEDSRPAWPIINERVDFLPVGPANCDGLIVIPTMSVEACQQYSADLLARGYPVVFAGLHGCGPGVAPDNAMGIRQAVYHLYEHGHRRIAFLAGFDNDERGDSGIRLQAYRQALAELGIPFDDALVEHGHHEVSKGQQAMRRILERSTPFSAVLTSNDLTAIGAMDTLSQAGYRIPQDIALIGFDNRVETRAQTPPLTTVHFPMFELGYQSLEMILDLLQGKVHTNEIRLIPADLVIRESCGCPPGETGKIARKVGSLHAAQARSSRNGSGQAVPQAGLPGRAPPSDENQTVQEIAAIIQTESHRMRHYDVRRLTRRCVEAFRESLVSAEPRSFLNIFQNILDQASAWQNDLFTWQYAITVLRESQNLCVETSMDRDEIDDMLDQARVMVSEAARAQSTRHIIRQAETAGQLEVMTNRLFAAQDEDEIFNILNQCLPEIRIEENAVLYFVPEGDDPYAYSELRSPHPTLPKGTRFLSRQFPPPGLFSNQTPARYALLPITIGSARIGYACFKVGSMEPLANIVRQLGASLQAVRLRQEALAGQRMAEEANRLKSRFLSMVSHELRAPLNLITGLCDLLLKDTNDNRPPNVPWDDLQRIYGSAQHLDSLIQDVLNLTMIDIGQFKLTCEPLDLKEVLQYVTDICKNLVHDKGLTWRCEVVEPLPRVWGDRTRLRQVTLNLLHNAIKFTRQGEIVLRAAVNEQGLVVVSVSDTGLGIPLDEQELIFQEFHQSERTAARGFGGLGLGLSICKRLVELHGGTISVSSSGKKNQGAVFTYTLQPIDERPLQRLGDGDQQASRILLMESPVGGSEVSGYLEEKGHEVKLLVMGEENNWLSQMLDFNPDLVVLDQETGFSHGWEVVNAMKGNPSTQNIPVLFYSVTSDGESGAFLELNYLAKPIKGNVLADALLQYNLVGKKSSAKTGPVILVVDDDPDLVEMQSRLIRTQLPEVRLRTAANGREALEIIRREPPALVLLDLLMPEVNGFEVLSEMRADRKTQGIPVIVITSQNLNQQDLDRLNQGFVSILGKTIFSKEEVLQYISSYIKDGRRRSSEAQQVVMKAMAFIHSHYKEPISRSDIANCVGLSERHLNRCFERSLGIAPITYLNRYRVHQARYLLDTRQIGITGVALEVGFSSSGYFARVFRSEMGISPREYLQQLIVPQGKNGLSKRDSQ